MKKIALLSLILASGNLFATDSRDFDCESKYSGLTDVGMCYVKNSEQDVQAKYKELLKLSDSLTDPAPIKKNLIASQSAWTKYKNAYCDSYFDYHTKMNGRLDCLVLLNNERTQQLQNDIDTFE